MLSELLALIPFVARLGGDPPIEPPPIPMPAPPPEPKPEEVKEPEEEDEPETDAAARLLCSLETIRRYARENAALRDELIAERRARAILEDAAQTLPLQLPSDAQRQLQAFSRPPLPHWSPCTCVPGRADMMLGRTVFRDHPGLYPRPEDYGVVVRAGDPPVR
jgi:hypothetical protein